MPQGNGMGPTGAGPMTGRRAGHCTGNNAPGWQTLGGGTQRGFWRSGKLHGFFRHHNQRATVTNAAGLQDRLEARRRQIASLEQQNAELGNTDKQ